MERPDRDKDAVCDEVIDRQEAILPGFNTYTYAYVHNSQSNPHLSVLLNSQESLQRQTKVACWSGWANQLGGQIEGLFYPRCDQAVINI